MTHAVLYHMLLSLFTLDYETPPENSTMSEEFRGQLKECSTGSVALVYKEIGRLFLFIYLSLSFHLSNLYLFT